LATNLLAILGAYVLPTWVTNLFGPEMSLAPSGTGTGSGTSASSYGGLIERIVVPQPTPSVP